MVISVFAIVILSILGGLYKSNHHEVVGGIEDPEDGPAVAGTIFTAVIVYAVRYVPPTFFRFYSLRLVGEDFASLTFRWRFSPLPL